MNTYTIIVSLFGLLGIGAIVNTIVDKFLQNRLEKNKILFDKKFESYSDLAKDLLGMGFAGDIKKDVFRALGDSSRVVLLLDNQDLSGRIRRFIVGLDSLFEERDNNSEGHNEDKYKRLMEEGKEIVIQLSKDLKDTLG